MLYRGLLIAAVLTLATACTPHAVKLLQTDPPSNLAPAALIEDVPFLLQTDNFCGPATLAMSLRHYGRDINIEQLAAAVYVPELNGSLQVEMAATLRREGLLAYQLPPSLNALLRELDSGHPVIVLQNLGLARWPRWHYALAIGYDLSSGELVLHSGENAYHRLRLKKFAHTWQRSNNWALVPLPPGNLPANDDPDGVFLAIVDLAATTGSRPDVEAAYQSGVNRWQRHTALILGLSNLYHSDKDYRKAIDVLLGALESDPNSAPIYNNLAYGLLELDCGGSARQAINCAVKNDNSLDYRSSKSEIDALASHTQQSTSCPVINCRD